MTGSGVTHQMAIIPIRWEMIHDPEQAVARD